MFTCLIVKVFCTNSILCTVAVAVFVVVLVLVSLKADYRHSEGLVNSDGLLWSACSGYSGTCIITHSVIIKINVWSIMHTTCTCILY